MEPEKDFWYWVSFFVALAVMLAWAVASALFNASTACAWVAGAVVVLAVGSVGVRAWLEARRVVWTEEMREAQRRHAWHQLRDLLWLYIPVFLLFGGMEVVQRLVEGNVLPQLVGAALVLILLAMLVSWIWFRRDFRKVIILTNKKR